jgi:hypothetical protein
VVIDCKFWIGVKKSGEKEKLKSLKAFEKPWIINNFGIGRFLLCIVCGSINHGVD